MTEKPETPQMTTFPDTRSPDPITEMRIALHHSGHPNVMPMADDEVRAEYLAQFPYGHIVKITGTRLARDTPESCCVKVLPSGAICSTPAEYVTESGAEISGWYHVDRSLTADHHAIPKGWA